MCIVSNIGEGWGRSFLGRYPGIFPEVSPSQSISPPFNITVTGISHADFDKLKAEVEELKKLLLQTKKFDEATDQPECEQEDKIALIKAVAKAVGVDIDEVFAPSRR